MVHEKRHPKGTWQHPKSKEWYCIDYASVRQKDRKMCLDATVMRGAECHTDHCLLQIKLRVHRVNTIHKQIKKGRKFNVGRILEGKLSDRGSDEVRKKFQQELSQKVENSWPIDRDTTCEHKWNVLRDSLKETADSVLGYEEKKQSDWYSESVDTIETALNQRNECYQRWLATGQSKDHTKFAKARAFARHTIREAKHAWFLSKAAEAQHDRFSGKKAWKCIRDMQ